MKTLRPAGFLLLASMVGGCAQQLSLADESTETELTWLWPPTKLQATTPTADAPALTWVAASKAVDYLVLRNGVTIGRTAELRFVDLAVTDTGAYFYSVKTVGPRGGVSKASNPLAVTLDRTAPSKVEGLSAGITGSSVVLSWAAASDEGSGLAGYRVLRDGEVLGLVSGLIFTDDTALVGKGYNYAISSVDNVGLVADPTRLFVSVPGTPSPPPLPSDRPYLPLLTEASNAAETRATNTLPVAELDIELNNLTRWYRHFHAEASGQFAFGTPSKGTSASTLAQKLTAKGAWVSNYRNGSYVSQASDTQPLNFGEAADLERRAPLAIGTFWPGRPTASRGSLTSVAATLAAPVSLGDTVLRIRSAASNKPAGAPEQWPYVASRGTGLEPGTVYSQNTHDFVSWVRIDDELCRIREVVGPTSDGIVTLTVDRGTFATVSTSHATGARVFSPVYIGSESAAASDANLSGIPTRNDTGLPLRYALKLWMPGAQSWISDQIARTFGPDFQGYDTVWLDVSSCNRYNNADPQGSPVEPWDDPQQTIMTNVRWGEHQQAKVAALRARFPGKKFTANSLGSNNACTQELLTKVDGGSYENYLKTGSWDGEMAMTFAAMQNNLPALFWVRWQYAFSGDPAVYKRFAYGAVLLAYRRTATRFQFGGAFGLSRPDELFFHDLGDPLGTPASLADVQVAGTSLYMRDFTRGRVLVNPTGAAITFALERPYLDLLRKNSSGGFVQVQSITVGPRDAAFLRLNDRRHAPVQAG